MEILFSPWFNGKTYVNYALHGGGLLGKAIASQAGLLGRLELLAGMAFPQEPDEEKRVREYFDILSGVIAQGDPLYNSFKADARDVSNRTTTELLHWRDSLLMAGWDGRSNLPDGKLKALEKAEPFVRSDGAIALGEPDRWRNMAAMTDRLKTASLRIRVFSPRELLPKVVCQVLDALDTVYEYRYDPDSDRKLDSSKFRVLGCKEKTQAYEWLAQQSMVQGQLVACNDSLRLDSVMRCFGRPETEDSQKGCHQVANSIFCMLDAPESLIWLDCNGDYGLQDDYAFMSAAELEAFHIMPYYRRLKVIHDYYIYTLNRVKGQIITVSARRDIDEPLQQHPILALLEITPTELHIKGDPLPASTEIRFKAKSEYNLEHGINMQHKLSATSLEQLLQNPFDYVVSKELNLSEPAEEAQISLEEGKVAHKVVELLVKDQQPLALNDDVMQKALEAEGNLLTQPENSFELNSFKETLAASLSVLDEIITSNGLTPVACEVKIETDIPQYGPSKAFIDMTLKTADGKDVIFDFKYSNSDRYQALLEDNRSVQFSFYRDIFKQKTGADVVAIGYYLFPKNTLYVPSGLGDDIIRGNHVQVVYPSDNADLSAQLARSFKFRQEQLEKGVIEEAQGMPVSDLEYSSQPELFSLDQDRGKKCGPYKATNIVLKNQIR